MGTAENGRELPGIDRRLTQPTADRWGRRLARGKVAPVLAAAALGSILVAAPVAAQVVDDSTTTSTDTTAPDTSTTETTAPDDSTTTSIDPFDTGTTVTSVEGDSSTSTPTTDFAKKGRVRDVKGDGVNQVAGEGSVELSGANGLIWYLNDDITSSTSSSASGAMSEASFTTPIPVTTEAGGTSVTTLEDAFDGYNTLCIDVNGETGDCSTDTSGVEIYYDNGPATLECSGQSAVFGVQNIDSGSVANLNVQRRVYVPSGGQFARWLNTFTNVDSVPTTFQANIFSNLGSDEDTISTGSSAGGAVSNGVTWFGTMEDYAVDGTSYDPRIGHVIQGSGGTLPANFLSYVDGDGYTTWGYSVTLQPGETVTIANFASLAGSKAEANALAASLAANDVSGQWGCMTEEQKAEVLNFDVTAVPVTPTTVTPTTETPTTEAPAAEAEQATGTLPYTGAGGELLPLAGAGAAAMAAGGAAVAATKRKLRRPRFRHGR